VAVWATGLRPPQGNSVAEVFISVMERTSGKYRAKLLDDSELEEHRQNIQQAKERLRAFPALQSADAPGTPDIPRPDGQSVSFLLGK
jgi:hypothetical protein